MPPRRTPAAVPASAALGTSGERRSGRARRPARKAFAEDAESDEAVAPPAALTPARAPAKAKVARARTAVAASSRAKRAAPAPAEDDEHAHEQPEDDVNDDHDNDDETDEDSDDDDEMPRRGHGWSSSRKRAASRASAASKRVAAASSSAGAAALAAVRARSGEPAGAASASSDDGETLGELPDEILEIVADQCDPYTRGRLALVNRFFHKLSYDEAYWKRVASMCGFNAEYKVLGRKATMRELVTVKLFGVCGKCLTPTGSFHVRVGTHALCKKCYNESSGYSRVAKGHLMSMFAFRESDAAFQALPRDYVRNPHYRSAAPMQLFTVSDAVEAAVKVHGSWGRVLDAQLRGQDGSGNLFARECVSAATAAREDDRRRVLSAALLRALPSAKLDDDWEGVAGNYVRTGIGNLSVVVTSIAAQSTRRAQLETMCAPLGVQLRPRCAQAKDYVAGRIADAKHAIVFLLKPAQRRALLETALAQYKLTIDACTPFYYVHARMQDFIKGGTSAYSLAGIIRELAQILHDKKSGVC